MAGSALHFNPAAMGLGDPAGDRQPQPGVGPAGEIYVAFQNSNTAAPDYRNNYLVVKSTDGGLTWGAPVVAAALVDGFNDYPLNVQGRQTFTGVQFRTASAGNIAVGPEGNVYLAFADNRNGSATNTNTDVLVVTSTTGGATWSAPEVVSGAASDQFYPWLAIGQASGSPPQVLFMDRSYDATAPATGKYGITLARKVLGSWVLSAVHTGLSDPNNSRWFGGLTGGKAVFIGDYNGLAVASDGTAWGAWTDMRRTVTTSGKNGQNIFVAGR